MPALLEAGALCQGSGVDALSFEAHPLLDVRLPPGSNTSAHLRQIFEASNAQGGCSATRWISKDDESHLHDMMIFGDGRKRPAPLPCKT